MGPCYLLGHGYGCIFVPTYEYGFLIGHKFSLRAWLGMGAYLYLSAGMGFFNGHKFSLRAWVWVSCI